MINSAGRRHSILLIHPVHLLFFAPDEIPVVALGLAPLAVEQCPIDAVTKRSLELDVRAELAARITNGWDSAPF